MIVRSIAILACLAAALPASAYCVHNEIQGRDVRISRDNTRGQAIDLVLKPGDKFCCTPKDTSCNPEGKVTANVDLDLTIQGQPQYVCGINGSAEVKVTGAGTIRVVNNPKKSSAHPFVLRVRTQDRDVSGPSGVACNEKKGS
nr:hypothetical protein [uncultured bacterium]